MNGRNPEDGLINNYLSEYGIQFGGPSASSRNQVPRSPPTPPPSRHLNTGPHPQPTYACVASGRGHVQSGGNFRHPFPETRHTRHSVQRHREPPPPTMIPKEVVIITAELHKKLRNASPFIALFYHKPAEESPQSSHHNQQHLTQTQFIESPTLKSWKWNDPSYVRIPLSREYTQDNDPKWHVIEDLLTRFKSACETRITPTTNHHHWFRKTISSYNLKAKNSSNFGVIQNDDGILSELLRLLPGIIDHALKLPCRLQAPIPVLKRGESRTIYLTRDLACSLLANAFLCTFPEQNGRSVPYFDFYSLFDEVDPIKTQVKREKVKCILKYFAELAQDNPNYPNTIISYERRHVSSKFNWQASTDKLSKIEIISQQRVENNPGMLQVDFANKWVGGGVLNEGAVQEEIRFVVSPELIVSRLFTEPLDDDEVLVVTGTAQYSSYTGYCDTFKWLDLQNYRRSELDNLGREHTQVVAMDALFFKPYEIDKQYKEDKLKRELHKCYVAFIPGRYPTPVATGLWGCGCFNGDPQLKFLIQWMAASVHRRPVVFHTHNDERQKDEFVRMAKFLEEKKVDVGKLYRILYKYSASCVEFKERNARKSVFAFVHQEVIGRFWGSGILGRGG